MATIEITWTMAAAVTGWAVTAAGLIKVYWKKSLDWDHAEKHHKLLLGDPDNALDLGLVRRVHALETAQVTDDRVKKLEADSKLLHLIAKSLNAYGPDDDAIVKAIEEKIQHIVAPPRNSQTPDSSEDDPFPPKNARKGR